MQKIVIVLCLCAFVFNSEEGAAQVSRVMYDSALYCSNRFNTISSRKDKSDSAAFLLGRLAVISPQTYPEFLYETIDHSFIGNFLIGQYDVRKFVPSNISLNALDSLKREMETKYQVSKIVLEKALMIKDSSLQKYLIPMKLWVDAMDLQKQNKGKRANKFFLSRIHK